MPYPSPDLDERTSGLLWMRNSPEGRTVAPSGCHCGVGQHRKEEENSGLSKIFQDFAIKQRKSRESPKEMQALGLDTVRSMGMWSVL